MQRRTYAFASVAFALSTLGATDAAATAQRTFVSTSGVDNPACSIAAPCRSFGAAITATTSDGEVIVLDSGGYGIVTITKAVSIIAPPGAYAGISVFASTDGIVVNAGAGDRVVLRGLTVNGQGGDRGIVVMSGLKTHIEDCTVSGLLQDGIRIEGGTHVHIARSIVRDNSADGLYVAAGTTEVHVSDTRFARNSENGMRVDAGSLDATRVISENNSRGMLVQPASAVVMRVTVTESSLVGNGTSGFFANAIVAGSTIRAALSRSHVAHNSSFGVAVIADVGAAIVVVTASSVVVNGSSGVSVSGANGTVIVGESSVAGQLSADLAQGMSGVLRTSLNNTLSGRGAPDVTGTLMPNPTQ